MPFSGQHPLFRPIRRGLLRFRSWTDELVATAGCDPMCLKVEIIVDSLRRWVSKSIFLLVAMDGIEWCLGRRSWFDLDWWWMMYECTFCFSTFWTNFGMVPAMSRVTREAFCRKWKTMQNANVAGILVSSWKPDSWCCLKIQRNSGSKNIAAPTPWYQPRTCFA